MPKLFQFLMGYALGFACWFSGLHCLQADSQGKVSISTRKLGRHLFKVFMWTLEICLVYNLLVIYRAWILSATVPEIATAFIVKSVVFLYIKVFWPQVFPEILPGMHVFFCPQCFQKQTFRFLPVSFQFGFFVTYLCRYCFCLVNGWGEQIFYPVNIPFKKVIPNLVQMIPIALLGVGAGYGVFKILWDLF